MKNNNNKPKEHNCSQNKYAEVLKPTNNGNFVTVYRCKVCGKSWEE